MKKLIMSSVFGVVVLMASSSIADEFVSCGIKWGDYNGLQGVGQDIYAPGCTVCGFCYWEVWSSGPGFSTTSTATGRPCTVYRNGVPIQTVNAAYDPQVFSDLDVVPGETYTYTVRGYRGGETDPINVTCQFIYTTELGAQELYFAADDNESAKKVVTTPLYKQTVEGKTSIPIDRNASWTSSDDWIKMAIEYDSQRNAIGIAIGVTPNDTEVAREGTVTFDYKGFSWPIKITQAGKSAATSYASWAVANGLSGAWDAKDENGIYNVFRYVFGNPTGKFEETPLIDIAFESGRSIVKTPAVVNTSDFSLSVEASDMADGTGGVINYPISSSGETVIDEAVKPSRFFRLKATLAQ